MTIATKGEAQANLNAARTKAQNASVKYQERLRTPIRNEYGFDVEMEALDLHQRRCVRELEEALNEYAKFDVTGDDE